MTKSWCLGLLACAPLLTACRSQPTVVGGESTVRLSAPDAAADELVWNAVQDSLRDYRFRIDRVDPREGVVTSLPETSKQYFEFWRKDAVTAYDVWESSINPIRRWVEVRVAKEPQAAERVVAVTVHKERLSSPDRQFNNSTAAYRFFGDALPSTTGITRVNLEHDRWLAMGRDPALEARLVDQIILRSQADVLERRETQTITNEPAEVPVESQPSAPATEPTPPQSYPTAILVQPSASPSETPDPAAAQSAPQPTSLPLSDDEAAIVPMTDVEGSTPGEPAKEADDQAARP